MRATILLTPFLLSLMLLASCSSPPKPPSVDEARRRPANTAMAVELQVCKNELQNTRLLATEAGLLAETATTTLVNTAARQQALASLPPLNEKKPRGNSVYSVRFEFGSSQVDFPADIAKALTDQAKAAPLVKLRGRTDGSSDSAVESRIARERATAVRDYLVAAGVDPSLIRTTYQPSGDHVADNSGPTGRALNRRVEIEIYQALPVAQAAAVQR
ncbi:OmpA family protein [Roseateles sp. LYH14W]|uniref:OmpA family protein n=1 Tax=Pelomonas parva TaxID=3299032 RepID=A0ABW7F8S5_9BURK